MKRTVAIILIFTVPMIMGLFQHFENQQKVSAALTEANTKFAELRRKNEIKYQEIQKTLEALYQKEHPTDHDRWHIGHLEKTSRLLEKAITPNPASTQSSIMINRMWLENGVMLFILLKGLGFYFFQQHRSRQQYPAPKGLSQNMPWIYPADDPVAETTHWQAMHSGAANFKTHKLIQSAQKLILKPSAQLTVFYGLFIAVGLNNVVFNYLDVLFHQGVQAFSEQPSLIFSQWLTVGTTFIVVGFAIRLLMSPSMIIFNQQRRQLIIDNKSLPFAEIHAIQVIEAIAGGHGSGVFKSYEMNLVLKNGERIHLIDHGDLSAFIAQVEKVSECLQVPIWKA